MEKAEKLKKARNTLLKLHKSLLDFERTGYEGVHGPLTAGAFLNLLLEDPDFSWLRKFSMLIVEIDEMFDIKDGIDPAMIDAALEKVRQLAEMEAPDENFRARYRYGLQNDVTAAGLQAELKNRLENA